MILGLTGRMGAGKDTVAERLRALLRPTVVERRAFADPLKDSVCALFGCSREALEELKNCDDSVVFLGQQEVGSWEMTVRQFLQRYGTEAHRGIFGEDFWLDATLPLVSLAPHAGKLIVLTDCRFPNEAKRVKDCGGLVYEVVGPDGEMDPEAEHASERALPGDLLDGHILNYSRDDSLLSLDRALKNKLIPELLGRG